MSHSSSTPNTSDNALLKVEGISRHFSMKKGWLRKKKLTLKAVDGISFNVYPSETLAIVGESGCGKSTLAHLIVGLDTPTKGSFTVLGKSLSNMGGADMLAIRKDLQMVFQDPYSSLNPRMTIGALLEEPLIIHKFGDSAKRQHRVNELLHLVGLSENYATRYPHQLSGGQRQRIGIARALAVEPKLIVCDEPVSSLDVSVQAQIINLLLSLQQRLGVSYLFIAHNLAVVKHIADRVAVMYLGRVVEIANKEELFSNPRHPYTQMLLSSVPRSHPDDRPAHVDVQSDLPSPLDVPSGCRFHTRCPYVRGRCREEDPELRGAGHGTACHFWEEIDAERIKRPLDGAGRQKQDYVVKLLKAFDALDQNQADKD